MFLFGESYFLEKKYEQALERFRLLRERYPSTRQAQLAGLEVGTCLYELERYPEAAAVLKQTLSVYPNPAVVKTKLDKVTSKLKLLKYDEPIKENEFWLSTQRRRQGAPPASSSQTDIPQVRNSHLIQQVRSPRKCHIVLGLRPRLSVEDLRNFLYILPISLTMKPRRKPQPATTHK